MEKLLLSLALLGSFYTTLAEAYTLDGQKFICKNVDSGEIRAVLPIADCFEPGNCLGLFGLDGDYGIKSIQYEGVTYGLQIMDNVDDADGMTFFRTQEKKQAERVRINAVGSFATISSVKASLETGPQYNENSKEEVECFYTKK